MKTPNFPEAINPNTGSYESLGDGRIAVIAKGALEVAAIIELPTEYFVGTSAPDVAVEDSEALNISDFNDENDTFDMVANVQTLEVSETSPTSDTLDIVTANGDLSFSA